ncbi:MAG: hypothetical protein AB7F35_27435 [Acetobacteraceae bacterium]
MSGFYSAVRLGPDKTPAKGEVLLEMPATTAGIPPEIRVLWVPGEVAICWRGNHKAMRPLSETGLASVRQKRLARRLEKDVPLFANEFTRRELGRRLTFYAGKQENAPSRQLLEQIMNYRSGGSREEGDCEARRARLS